MSDNNELVNCGGCIGIVVVAVLAILIGQAISTASVSDATPRWWVQQTMHGSREIMAVRQPVTRILLLSLLCIPTVWLVRGYITEAEDGFIDDVSHHSFLFWDWWSTDQTWVEKWLFRALTFTGITYLALFAVSAALYCAVIIVAYVFTGTYTSVEYSFMVFIVTALTMCAAFAASASPVHYLVMSGSTARRLWAAVVILFEAIAVFAEIRAIVSHIIR